MILNGNVSVCVCKRWENQSFPWKRKKAMSSISLSSPLYAHLPILRWSNNKIKEHGPIVFTFFLGGDMIGLSWKGSKLMQLIGSSGITPCLNYQLSKTRAVLVQGLPQDPNLHLAEVTRLSWSSAVCQGQLRVTVAREDWWGAIVLFNLKCFQRSPFLPFFMQLMTWRFWCEA